jgi:hypothetical protein
MTRPKKQHYVPQRNLRHFVGGDPPGMVWTYDVDTRRVAPSLPSETGAEMNFYSVRDESGQWRADIERPFSSIETKAAEPYERLMNGDIPTGQARRDFSIFIATLYARSSIRSRRPRTGGSRGRGALYSA